MAFLEEFNIPSPPLKSEQKKRAIFVLDNDEGDGQGGNLLSVEVVGREREREREWLRM